jgi:hypothetical protein
MNENPIPPADAARCEPAGDARHCFGELGVGPSLHGALERRPDQRRMRATLAGTRLDQRGDIPSGKGMNGTDVGDHDATTWRP